MGWPKSVVTLPLITAFCAWATAPMVPSSATAQRATATTRARLMVFVSRVEMMRADLAALEYRAARRAGATARELHLNSEKPHRAKRGLRHLIRTKPSTTSCTKRPSIACTGARDRDESAWTNHL